MQCSTFEYINIDGKEVLRPKKQFDRLDDAIVAAKILNCKPNRFNKVVAYKCRMCHKYHLGRNGKTIKEKDRIKWQKKVFKTPNQKVPNFKVVGYVDLDKINY